MAVFHFGLAPDTYNRELDFTVVAEVRVVTTSVLFMNRMFFTVWVFFCKHLWSAMRHPGCYVILRARLKSVKLTVGGLREAAAVNHTIHAMPKLSSLSRSSKSMKRHSMLAATAAASVAPL